MNRAKFTRVDVVVIPQNTMRIFSVKTYNICIHTDVYLSRRVVIVRNFLISNNLNPP
jgi:hypothetical protein